LSAGIGQNLWIPVAKEYPTQLSNMANYIAPAAKMQALAGGCGVETVYYPAGPLLQYDPAVVKDVPKTPAALLAWAKANPDNFGCARPANSGPGRTDIRWEENRKGFCCSEGDLTGIACDPA
jgi:putative spermidine/putrescine transport system substrate-binding protein